MNKDTAKDYLPLLQALAEGKTIQWVSDGGVWVDPSSSDKELFFTHAPSRYRIKSEPKKQSYRISLHKDKDEFYTTTADNENEERRLLESDTFIEWLTDRIEYTLPEGDA